MEWKREKYRIADNPAEVDIPAVTRLLAETHWGHRRPRAIIEQLVKNSLCFSLFFEREQIGFARVASDYTVFSWLSDLVIADAYRHQGLGRWMLECVLAHPSVSQTQFVLQTSTAFDLYEDFGFEKSEKLMSRASPAKL